MALRGRLAILVLVLLGAALCGCRAEQPNAQLRFATRNGDVVTLHPIPVTIHLPSQWMDWFTKFHNNFHLSRRELAAVENGEGEWDTEYAAVVNSALPFGDCAVHVGGEGWGKEGVSFADVQLRAYITRLSIADVYSRFAGPAMEVARRVAHSEPGSLPALNTSDFNDDEVRGRWHELEISYPLWYSDYGGRAHIRVFATHAEHQTVVLVFMGGRQEEVNDIVEGVKIE